MTDLFALAGNGCSRREGIFEETDSPVIVEYTERGCAFNNYSEVIPKAVQSYAIGKWMDISSGELCEPDKPYPLISKVVISRAFAIDRTQTINTFNQNLSFMYIVLGKSGKKAKVVIQPNFWVAAAGIMQEAMRGYSIVFSAALHCRSATMLKYGFSNSFRLGFVRVHTWKELIDAGGVSVGHWEKGDPVGTLKIDICF